MTTGTYADDRPKRKPGHTTSGIRPMAPDAFIPVSPHAGSSRRSSAPTPGYPRAQANNSEHSAHEHEHEKRYWPRPGFPPDDKYIHTCCGTRTVVRVAGRGLPAEMNEYMYVRIFSHVGVATTTQSAAIVHTHKSVVTVHPAERPLAARRGRVTVDRAARHCAVHTRCVARRFGPWRWTH